MFSSLPIEPLEPKIRSFVSAMQCMAYSFVLLLYTIAYGAMQMHEDSLLAEMPSTRL